jgi:hypothetical protein
MSAETDDDPILYAKTDSNLDFRWLLEEKSTAEQVMGGNLVDWEI